MSEDWKYSSLDFKTDSEITEEQTAFETDSKIEFMRLTRSKYRQIKRRYEDATTIDNDRNWNDGVYIHLKKGVKAQAKNTFFIKNRGKVVSKTYIFLEEGSHLDYVEEHASEDVDAYRNSSIEIYLSVNSTLNFHNFQDWKSKIKSTSNWTAFLEKDATVKFFFSQFGGKFSRIKIDAYLNQGSKAVTRGIFFADSDQVFDFTSNMNHQQKATHGDVLVKGALKDSSKSIFRGMIKIEKEAQQTNSYLSDHSLMLSKEARSYSIPGLEIDANDVKASHGATIGKPDPEELFYLMARGLDKRSAEKIMITGFFSPVLEGINYLKEEIDNAILVK